MLANDVTDRINAEAEARRSNEMLEAVIDNIPQRVFWKDRDLHYLGCNNAFARDADLAYNEQVYRRATEEKANKALDKVLAAAAGSKVKCEKVVTKDAQPWEGIIGTARALKCDLIVMGSHGRGALGALLVGSETSKVLSHSSTPVLVCRA